MEMTTLTLVIGPPRLGFGLFGRAWGPTMFCVFCRVLGELVNVEKTDGSVENILFLMLFALFVDYK